MVAMSIGCRTHQTLKAAIVTTITSIVKPGRAVGNRNQLLVCNPVLGRSDTIRRWLG
jgi:hypothetical protein